MANTDSIEVLKLLGQTVSLVDHVGGDVQHTGQVLAVVVPIPGACVGTSVLLDLPLGPEYFDLDDCTLVA